MDTPVITSYCSFTQNLPSDNVHKYYHDYEYGFPLNTDDELFGRLVLEINQAGLSWTTILNKRGNFFKAYDAFAVDKVAAYSDKKISQLLSDDGIIRNRLKINAAIYNANVIKQLQKEYGSFSNWLDAHHPLTKEEWVKLFKKQFKFVGGEIVNEFLMSTGYLAGAHQKDCPIYKIVEKLEPRWMVKK
jgi:DNA-3-methyladenine glycosylase I